MIRNLVFSILVSAVLAVILAGFCHLVFPDILPYAVGETETAPWRRLVAFLITAIALLSAEFAVMLTIVLAAHLWKRLSLTRSERP
jgi:hypothetical protein